MCPFQISYYFSSREKTTMSKKKISLNNVFAKIVEVGCHDKSHTSDKSHACCNVEKLARNLRKFVFEVLDKKDSSCFVYEPDDGIRTSWKIKHFARATLYTFDENTMFWIVRDCRDAGLIRLFVKILAVANVTGYSVLNLNASGSKLVQEMMACQSDETIFWLISQKGFQPNSLCYQEYGSRKDRSLSQKIAMFETLYSKYKIPFDMNIITACYSFSTNVDDVRVFITWFHSRGARGNGHDISNGFHLYGMQLIPFLLDMGLEADMSETIKKTRLLKTRSLTERIKALRYCQGKFDTALDKSSQDFLLGTSVVNIAVSN